MEDVYGEVTYILLHSAEYKKDNRLPPQGFTSQGLHYDTTAVKGLAAQDPNFNRDGSMEGTAADTVRYEISNLNQGQVYQLAVKIYYQTLSPRFAENLFEYNTPEVQTFQNYYNPENNRPITLDSLQLAVLPPTGIEPPEGATPDSPFLLSAYPNPFNPQITIQVEVAEPGDLRLDIYNLLGQPVKTFSEEHLHRGTYHFTWNTKNVEDVAATSGEYFIKAEFAGNAGKPSYTLFRKIILMK
jgi:hypothetical protein